MIDEPKAEQQPKGQMVWLPFNAEWHQFVFAPDSLYWCQDGAWHGASPNMTKLVLELHQRYEKNPLQFFLPHGGGVGFLNDWENGICMLVAPSRCGKSCHGTAWALLRTIRCDPKWTIFTEHGIDYHEWRGPRKLVISSYSWSNVEEVWQEYRKWIPRELLGPYAPAWGKYPSEHGRQKNLSFGSGREQKIRLTDGCTLLFLCDTQSQGPWEGKRFDDGHFDEQRQREKFIGYLRGTANTQGLVQAGFTLTGHVLPERPDTGSGGWIHDKLWLGNYTFGKTVGRYHISMDDVPDAVLSPERKAELYKQWVEEPTKNQDEEMLRKAEARYHGRWESGAGLVIDNFEPKHHLIPAYDRNHHIVIDATKYRGIDHGLGRPGACVWLDVFPWGDIVLCREYFQKGKTIPYHAKEIVRLSGNEVEKVGTFEGVDMLSPYPTYRERMTGEQYQSSVLDGRSFASPSQERPCTLGQLYQDCGLDCSPASGGHNYRKGGGGQVQRLKRFFAVEAGRPHIMTQFNKRGMISPELYQRWLKDHDGNPNNGSHLYVVVDCRWVQAELRQWAINPKTGLPESKHDHLMAALKYVIAEDPAYWGSKWNDVKMIAEVRQQRDREKSRFKYVRY